MDKRENSIDAVLLNSSDSKPAPAYINVPLSEIEMDIHTLMKRCGNLTYDLSESRKKWESDTKKMLLDFIEAVDAFENLFRNIRAKEESADQQTKIWIGNFRTIYKILLRALKRAGVAPLLKQLLEKRQTLIGTMSSRWLNNPIQRMKQLLRKSKKGICGIENYFERQMSRPLEIDRILFYKL